MDHIFNMLLKTGGYENDEIDRKYRAEGDFSLVEIGSGTVLSIPCMLSLGETLDSL
jgi:hypothetical protein